MLGFEVVQCFGLVVMYCQCIKAHLGALPQTGTSHANALVTYWYMNSSLLQVLLQRVRHLQVRVRLL